VPGAYRVVDEPPISRSVAFAMGLLFDAGGEVLYLNDVAVARTLGRRLGDDLHPLAYAELLAEFYSVPDIDRPVVEAAAPSRSSRAGWLVDDVAAAVERFPWVDPSLFIPPVVRRSSTDVTVEFISCHQRPHSMPAAVDVLQWMVAGGPGRDPSWYRNHLAMNVEMP
jgi:hypothetical protein